VKAVNKGMSIADIDCPSGRAVKEVFNETMHLIIREGKDVQNDKNLWAATH